MAQRTLLPDDIAALLDQTGFPPAGSGGGQKPGGQQRVQKAPVPKDEDVIGGIMAQLGGPGGTPETRAGSNTPPPTGAPGTPIAGGRPNTLYGTWSPEDNFYGPSNLPWGLSAPYIIGQNTPGAIRPIGNPRGPVGDNLQFDPQTGQILGGSLGLEDVRAAWKPRAQDFGISGVKRRLNDLYGGQGVPHYQKTMAVDIPTGFLDYTVKGVAGDKPILQPWMENLMNNPQSPYYKGGGTPADVSGGPQPSGPLPTKGYY